MSKTYRVTIAGGKIRSLRWDGNSYMSKSDVVAWLRRCAHESETALVGNIAKCLAQGLEEMDEQVVDHHSPDMEI